MQIQKCPCCGGEMEKGIFRSRGGNYFLPDGEKTPSFYTKKSMAKRNAILLPPDPFAMEHPIQQLNGFMCRACKIIIIPYEE